MQTITTIPELKRAIRSASEVLIIPRFGVSEGYIKISKKTALELIEGIPEDATPQHHEIWTESFGRLHSDNSLTMG